MRRYVGKWDGKLSVRSGTARIAIVPPWDEDVPLTVNSKPKVPLSARLSPIIRTDVIDAAGWCR